LAKHGGAFKSEKRKKELLRHKKQEEKRQRRLKKDVIQGQDSELPTPEQPEQKDEVSFPIQDA